VQCSNAFAVTKSRKTAVLDGAMLDISSFDGLTLLVQVHRPRPRCSLTTLLLGHILNRKMVGADVGALTSFPKRVYLPDSGYGTVRRLFDSRYLKHVCEATEWFCRKL
jgi:hypothetical protein